MSKNRGDLCFSHRLSQLACGVAIATAATAAAAAEPKTLYIGMNGGDMERAYTQHVFPGFEQANNVKIVVVPGTSTDVLAKAQAYKDKPQMHLMLLDDGVMSRAISMNLCQKMPDDPVFKDLFPSAIMKDGMAVGIDIGITGLGYNTKMFADNKWPAPTSWMDLADPKFKRHVVFQSASSSSFGLHGFLMFNRIQGGSENNTVPGFKAWADTIGPNVLEYIPNSAKLAEMAQNGEAAIFPLTPTSVARLQKRDLPVGYAHPKEGGVILMVGQCVIANNTEPDLANKLALYMLSPESQTKALEFAGQFPSNRTVKPIAGQEADFKQTQDYIERSVTLDWDVLNATRPAFNAKWNREIER